MVACGQLGQQLGARTEHARTTRRVAEHEEQGLDLQFRAETLVGEEPGVSAVNQGAGPRRFGCAVVRRDIWRPHGPRTALRQMLDEPTISNGPRLRDVT